MRPDGRPPARLRCDAGAAVAGAAAAAVDASPDATDAGAVDC